MTEACMEFKYQRQCPSSSARQCGDTRHGGRIDPVAIWFCWWRWGVCGLWRRLHVCSTRSGWMNGQMGGWVVVGGSISPSDVHMHRRLVVSHHTSATGAARAHHYADEFKWDAGVNVPNIHSSARNHSKNVTCCGWNAMWQDGRQCHHVPVKKSPHFSVFFSSTLSFSHLVSPVNFLLPLSLSLSHSSFVTDYYDLRSQLSRPYEF